jgi:transketolase
VRTAFIETLCELASERDDLVLMCGDLGFSVLERFAERFPDRYINAGIAEQNMTGMAAGMALAGKVVVTYSIANFAILRCLEQFRNDACYHNAPVIVVSVGTGTAYGSQGYTHHGIEDIAITRTLPNVAVVSPGDPEEVRWALRELVKRRGPANLRLGRGGEPAVHAAGALKGTLDKAIILSAPGRDVTLLGMGSALPEAIAACKRLQAQGIDAGVASLPSIMPFDVDFVAHAAQKSSLLVTVEENITEGGLGSAVSEVVAQARGPRAAVIRAGIARNGTKTATDQKESRRINGFDADGLVRRVESALSKVK